MPTVVRSKVVMVNTGPPALPLKPRAAQRACAASGQAGDPAVGKTSLVQMFSSSGQRFPKTYQMTCGVEFVSKQVPIPDTDISVELHIFDTGGQDLFTEMLPGFWKVRLRTCARARALAHDVRRAAAGLTIRVRHTGSSFAVFAVPFFGRVVPPSFSSTTWRGRTRLRRAAPGSSGSRRSWRHNSGCPACWWPTRWTSTSARW
eukprot:Transcript_31630.p1 GENE.Transcript_31630~~Transcript_31630.p1  ORF type:complete len:203 (-),score=12.29 Transcript_31630:168-776(-)